jgi:DNA-binding NarL/FixJ family response regulator
MALTAGRGMVDVVVADDQEVFRIGMAEVLGVEDDIRVVGKPESLKQLMDSLTTLKPHVLILSRSFLPAFPKIRRMLKRHQSALLVLTEKNDQIAYVRLLLAQGILYRSMEGSEMVDAVRRVARAEPLAQNLGSDHARKSLNQPAD